jgi:hypothetical protein
MARTRQNFRDDRDTTVSIGNTDLRAGVADEQAQYYREKVFEP